MREWMIRKMLSEQSEAIDGSCGSGLQIVHERIALNGVERLFLGMISFVSRPGRLQGEITKIGDARFG